MLIRVVKVTAKGVLYSKLISSDVEALHRELGGPVDNIKLFSDVLTFVRRQPNDLHENKLMPGVFGDILFTGGKGSYLSGLSQAQVNNLALIFGKDLNHGKARL